MLKPQLHFSFKYHLTTERCTVHDPIKQTDEDDKMQREKRRYVGIGRMC